MKNIDCRLVRELKKYNSDHRYKLYRVQGTGYRVQGTGYRVQGTGYRVQSTEYRVQGTEYRIQGGVQS